MKALKKAVIGLLLISTPRFRDLGEGTEQGYFRERKEQAADKLRQRLDFAETVFPGVVYTRQEVKNAIREFTAAQVDMVFAMFLSWSDDYAWIRFLRDMPPVPVLFACIAEDTPGFSDSFTEDRFVEFLSKGGLVGSLEGSGSIARFGRPMTGIVTGELDQVLAKAKSFALCAAARSQLKDTVFALLPSYNEVMWATYVDPYSLFMNAGPELRFLSVSSLEDEIAAIPAETVESAAARLLASYPHDDDLQMDKMYASIAASLALESLARKAGAELLVLNDVDVSLLTRIGLRPGFCPCPGADDVMVVPEGDIGCGLACWLLGKLSGARVNFIEPFYIHPQDNTFAVGHAGPQDYTVPNGKTRISLDTRFAKSSYKYAGAPFAWHLIGPGQKTMLHISQSGGSFKMAATVVEALECDYFLAGYSHGILRSDLPAGQLFERLMRFGVTQHYALAGGDWRRELAAFAGLMGFEYLEL